MLEFKHQFLFLSNIFPISFFSSVIFFNSEVTTPICSKYLLLKFSHVHSSVILFSLADSVASLYKNWEYRQDNLPHVICIKRHRSISSGKSSFLFKTLIRELKKQLIS